MALGSESDSDSLTTPLCLDGRIKMMTTIVTTLSLAVMMLVMMAKTFRTLTMTRVEEPLVFIVDMVVAFIVSIIITSEVVKKLSPGNAIPSGALIKPLKLIKVDLRRVTVCSRATAPKVAAERVSSDPPTTTEVRLCCRPRHSNHAPFGFFASDPHDFVETGIGCKRGCFTNTYVCVPL